MSNSLSVLVTDFAGRVFVVVLCFAYIWAKSTGPRAELSGPIDPCWDQRLLSVAIGSGRQRFSEFASVI